MRSINGSFIEAELDDIQWAKYAKFMRAGESKWTYSQGSGRWLSQWKDISQTL